MKKIIMLVSIVMLLSIPLIYAVEQDDVLASLKEFYESGKAEDVDRYYDSQDPLFLDTLGDKESIKGYFSGTFAQFDTISYEIVSPSYQIRDNQALVFYSLKSQIRLTETGETKDLDNDMVAFLWKYDNGWKVRYTILESLYEQKLIETVASLAAMDVLAESADNLTIQQEMEANGLYKVDEKFLTTPESNKPWLLYAAIAIVIVVVVFFMLKKKDKILKSKKNSTK